MLLHQQRNQDDAKPGRSHPASEHCQNEGLPSSRMGRQLRTGIVHDGARDRDRSPQSDGDCEASSIRADDVQNQVHTASAGAPALARMMNMSRRPSRDTFTEASGNAEAIRACASAGSCAVSTKRNVRPAAPRGSHPSSAGMAGALGPWWSKRGTISTSRKRLSSDSTGSAKSSRPSTMKPTQSASRSTSSTSCDETSTVHSRSRGTSSRARTSSSRTTGSRPENGSSSTTRSGRYASEDKSAAFILVPREEAFSDTRDVRPSEVCSCAQSSTSHDG